ncbi:hypothetical protein JCM10908_003266 [Rhodotorula pacifica]|uniref:tRNA (guanine(9)-N(1))-methyltransferase n=1 Tax=Rhodotorula pacifica TaxID=1495444 RepID=UPI00317F913F
MQTDQPVVAADSHAVNVPAPPPPSALASDTSTAADAPPQPATQADSASVPPMTKSALKRQRRQEAWQATKLARRAAEKDKRKQKQAETRRLVAEGLIEKPTDGPTQRKKQKRRELQKEKEPHSARVCIDMDFDNLMSEKEIKSMASQIAYCYSANRLSSHPFPLLITSFTGRIRQAYEKREDWKSWKGVEWWEEGLEQLYEGVPEEATEATKEGQDEAAQKDDAAPVPSTSASTSETPTIAMGSLSGQPRSRAPRSTVVYLTGDSPNILTSLQPGHTYILGGIVDRNRHKFLCLEKAQRLGISHAQLPIGEALPELKTRKVLTVNQVLEILVKWVDEGGKEGKEGWEGALRSVMPTRKFESEGKKKRREAKRAANGGGAAGDEEEDGEDSEEEDGSEQEDNDGVYVARDDDDVEDDGESAPQPAVAEAAPTADIAPAVAVPVAQDP